jgi:hypothetical protein
MEMPMKRSIVALAVTLCSIPATAFAQSDPARADQLYKEAVELFKQGNVPYACTKLDESFNADPKTQTLFSLAKCRQREGKIATAMNQFVELVKRGEREGDATKLAEYKAKVAELDPLVPRAVLKLEALPDVTEVRLDNKPLPRNEWTTPIMLDPGEHTFQVSATGRKPGEKTVSVKERETVTVQIDLPSDGSKDTGPVTQPEPTPSTGEEKKTPVLGYILGGAGIVFIGVGTGTGIMAIRHNDKAEDRFAAHEGSYKDSQDRASNYALASTITFGVGIACLAAGAYFIFFDKPSKSTASTNRIRIDAGLDRILVGGQF